MTRLGRAAVYDSPNAPFVVREYPVRPVKPREVLVRVTMSTICRSDIHSHEGRRSNPVPGILGHEIIGVIEEIGAGVERDMRGDPLRAATASRGRSTSSTASAGNASKTISLTCDHCLSRTNRGEHYSLENARTVVVQSGPGGCRG